ncbi:hypothetical protein ACFQZX_17810 [Mucilaginibacter litoreus]|uniref:Uncharacterized protein n=1 Tax=Mucilaginibacter litoreus TaxID=1048221 RepID=A0ABW3AWR8_9SPHI
MRAHRAGILMDWPGRLSSHVAGPVNLQQTAISLTDGITGCISQGLVLLKYNISIFELYGAPASS